MRDIRAKRFAPVYVLMGEEAYFIDQLANQLERNVLNDDERDFNQTILYGAESTAEQVLDAAGRYPMMAEHQLVIVREAQSMKEELEKLVPYVQNPNTATVLVICYKHGMLDKRRKLAATAAKNGVVFESKKLWDNQLPPFVNGYLKDRKLSIERSACDLLCDSVGNDLVRLSSELDKLSLALLPGVTEINVALVAEQVGQSKEYNAFALIDALAVHDVYKSMRIVSYFGTNPRGFALQPVTSSLFTFFGNLLLSFYAPDKTEGGVANFTGANPVSVRRTILPAQKFYSGRKVLQIIRYLRVIDAKSKGVDCPNTSDFDLLRDLVYFILH